MILTIISIQVNPRCYKCEVTSYYLREGDTLQLEAVVKPDNASEKTVTWSSSNDKVLSVDDSGLINAIKAGNAYVRVQSNDSFDKTPKFDMLTFYVVDESAKCGDSLYWNIEETEDECILTISGSGEMYDYYRKDESDHSVSIRAIPWIKYRDTITKIRIGEDVTSIGYGAFKGMSSLVSIEGGTNVKSIAREAFKECSSIESIDCFKNITSIGREAFYRCSAIKELNGFDNVLEVGLQAFFGCKSLVSVNGFRSLKKISGVFNGCSKLEAVYGFDSVSAIGRAAFSGTKLTDISGFNNVISIGRSAFAGCPIVSIDGFNSVEILGEEAFYACTSLETINGFQKLKTIGKEAFKEAYSLKQISNLAMLETIGERAFDSCRSLEKIDLPVHLKTIGPQAFRDCKKLSEIHIPKSIEEVGYGAFSGDLFNTLYISEACTNIENLAGLFTGNNAYYQVEEDSSSDEKNYMSEDGVIFNIDGSVLIRCAEGKEGVYTIPESVVELSPRAFQYCTGLEKVILPPRLIEIPERAFEYCFLLSEITIPASVEKIGNEAFSNCDHLKEVTFENNSVLGEIGDFAFHHYGSSYGLENHGSSIGSYSIQSIVFPEKLQKIGSGAFTGNKSLKRIVLPVSVKAVYYSFSGCELEEIEYGGFTSQYTQLTSMPDKNDIILQINAHGDIGELFWKAEGLSGDLTLTISGSGPMPDFKSASEAPWYDGKDEIRRIVIEDGVTHVGRYAFYQYDQIEEITLPSTVTSYGWSALRGIPNLETFHYYVEDTAAPSLDISVQYLVAKYSGNTYEPDVKVVHSTDGSLKRGTDFEVTYKGTRNKGNGLITVTFLNKYASFGSWCVPFVVDSSYIKGDNIKALEAMTLLPSSYPYDGRVKEPGPR